MAAYKVHETIVGMVIGAQFLGIWVIGKLLERFQGAGRFYVPGPGRGSYVPALRSMYVPGR